MCCLATLSTSRPIGAIENPHRGVSIAADDDGGGGNRTRVAASAADDAEEEPDLLGQWLAEFAAEPRHEVDGEGTPMSSAEVVGGGLARHVLPVGHLDAAASREPA